MYWVINFGFYSLVLSVPWELLFVWVFSVCLLQVEQVCCHSSAFAFSGLWGLLPDQS